jgi:uncharacterized protein YgiB involved in biofilm formation
MRRSATVTLTLLAGAGLSLAYCSGDPDAEGVLETQAACTDRLGGDAAAECAEVFQSARVTHAATAPRFDSAEACRAAIGTDCTPLENEPRAAGVPWASAAGSVFIPAMAGVMIGRALADGTRGATPVYAGGVPPACLPGTPGVSGCPPASSSGSASSGGSATGGGRRYWYSGSAFAGSSQDEGQAGFRRASPSTGGEGLLSRGARPGGHSSSSGLSGSRSGGLGFSAAAHASGGS